MLRFVGRDDRRALLVGMLALAATAMTYGWYADAAGRPLAVLALPALLTAVLGGWRPTVLVGAAVLGTAVVLGLSGPLPAAALTARWLIISIAVLAGAVGAAVRERQAARISEQDGALLLLQAFERGLVPLPSPPVGLAVTVRYRPAEARLKLGGDFVEAVGLTGERLAVLIGDVCGHGPREAAIGTALRAGWKGIALSGRQDPVEWVHALEEAFFKDGRITTYVTLCTGLVDLRAGTMRLISAGHPPPIAIGTAPCPVSVAPSLPLGLDWTQPRTATDLAWDGTPLLFYTDGLVENPAIDARLPRRWDEAGLLDWLDRNGPVGEPHAFLDALLRDATAGRRLQDDVAMALVTPG